MAVTEGELASVLQHCRNLIDAADEFDALKLARRNAWPEVPVPRMETPNGSIVELPQVVRSLAQFKACMVDLTDSGQ